MKQAIASILLTFSALYVGYPSTDARAVDDTITLTIKDHRFDPAQVEVPAGRKFKLLVENLDPTPEEFESHDLKREKVIPGKGQATITLGPLKPGTYKFVGEYNEKTAHGQIVAQ